MLGWDDYATRWTALHGGYDPRRASPVVRGWLRLAYRTGCALARLHTGPNLVTVLGLLLSAAVPLVGGRPGGWALAGALLVVASALADTVDGALAVITGRVSRLGQVYDSAADRIAEACWLLTLVLLGAPVWLSVVCGAVVWLHEYVRARATVAGMAEIGAVTVGERPTRVLVVAFALAGAGLAGTVAVDRVAIVVTVATVVWTVFGAIAFAQLCVAVVRALR